MTGPPHSGKSYMDERATFDMPAHTRAMEQAKRYQSAIVRGKYPAQLDDDPYVWYQGSKIHGDDEALTHILDEASCLSDVRGDDYLDRLIPQYLSAIQDTGTDGDGDPLSTGRPEGIGHYTEAYQRRIQNELAGLAPDTGRPARKAFALEASPPAKPPLAVSTVTELDPSEWLSIKRAAFELHVTPATIRAWLRSGKLASDVPGRVQRRQLNKVNVTIRKPRRRIYGS